MPQVERYAMTRRQFAELIAASVAAGLGPRVHAQDGNAMRRYIDRVRSDLARLRSEQLEALNTAGDRLAERVAAGGRLLIYDLRGEYTAEALGRAGGLMGIARVGPNQAAMVGAKDALLIVADEPANAADLALAQAAQGAGALVVGICPVREAEGALSRMCDVAIDNYVTDADAAVTVAGKAIAPTSGVLNTAILWAVTAAYIEAMERRGKPPHVWMSIKRPGAKEFNDAALAATREAGY
jgi:uncharacterized phosphosugar-binding protein